MHEDVFERRPVSGFGGPTLANQQLVTFRTSRRNGKAERVATDAPNDGRAVDVLVRHIAGQEFPEDDPKRPDIYFFVARLVSDDL